MRRIRFARKNRESEDLKRRMAEGCSYTIAHVHDSPFMDY